IHPLISRYVFTEMASGWPSTTLKPRKSTPIPAQYRPSLRFVILPTFTSVLRAIVIIKKKKYLYVESLKYRSRANKIKGNGDASEKICRLDGDSVVDLFL